MGAYDEKIVNQSKVWASHGNHQGMYGFLIGERRESESARANRRPPETFDSIGELMQSERKRRRRRSNR